MFSWADVYYSWLNWATARLQQASSQAGSSLIAFSQFMMAFSSIPSEKQASARFLQKQCFRLYRRHFSMAIIDSEQRPSMFSAAALLLWMCRDTSYSWGVPAVSDMMPSHTSRHSFALPLYRQRQERYSAADKLLGLYLSAPLNSSMALSVSDFNASLKRSKEFFSMPSRTITSSVSFFYSFSTTGSTLKGSTGDTFSSLLSPFADCSDDCTVFSWMPKPDYFC